jgi:curved DNA-binding protein CbpA
VRNLYKVLGIASTADDSRIKSAFRHRVKAVHPDLHPGSARADERFRELMQAYEVLRNAQARAAYDAHLARRRSDARHRFAQSAAVMATTFVLTTGSAFFVMGVHGMTVGTEGWQLAAAWRSSVQIEAPFAAPSEAGDKAGAPFTTTVVASAPAARQRNSAGDTHPAPARTTYSVRSRKPEPEAPKVAGIAPKASPGHDPVKLESHWPWPTSDERPYGLGASDLR